MKKLLVFVFSTAIAMTSLVLVEPGFADVPQIRNVTIWKDDADTKLNVSVYHNQEISSHMVDRLAVNVNNTTLTFPQTTPGVLDPVTSTFNVTLNIGLIVGTPSATVAAHCNLHGNSSQNWTGIVPEIPFATLTLLAVAIMSSITLFVQKRKAMVQRCK